MCPTHTCWYLSLFILDGKITHKFAYLWAKVHKSTFTALGAAWWSWCAILVLQNRFQSGLYHTAGVCRTVFVDYFCCSEIVICPVIWCMLFIGGAQEWTSAGLYHCHQGACKSAGPDQQRGLVGMVRCHATTNPFWSRFALTLSANIPTVNYDVDLCGHLPVLFLGHTQMMHTMNTTSVCVILSHDSMCGTYSHSAVTCSAYGNNQHELGEATLCPHLLCQLVVWLSRGSLTCAACRQSLLIRNKQASF